MNKLTEIQLRDDAGVVHLNLLLDVFFFFFYSDHNFILALSQKIYAKHARFGEAILLK